MSSDQSSDGGDGTANCASVCAVWVQGVSGRGRFWDLGAVGDGEPGCGVCVGRGDRDGGEGECGGSGSGCERLRRAVEQCVWGKRESD